MVMLNSAIRALVLLLCASSPLLGQNAPQEVPHPSTQAPLTDPAEIIRRVAAHEDENQKKRHNYTYEE